MSHVGTLEALDMSHLLLLLNLTHAFVFFLQGAISYMVTVLLAPEASDESILWLKLHHGGLGGFAVLPRCGTAASLNLYSLQLNYCILDTLRFFKFPLDFGTVGLVSFLMWLDACFS